MTLYYESHVTIDPLITDHAQQLAVRIGQRYGFHLAKLYMDKGVPNQKDSFFTARRDQDIGYAPIAIATHAFVWELKEHGFAVRRYKIEETLIDSRIKDELSLL